jgi:predicted GTPase
MILSLTVQQAQILAEVISKNDIRHYARGYVVKNYKAYASDSKIMLIMGTPECANSEEKIVCIGETERECKVAQARGLKAFGVDLDKSESTIGGMYPLSSLEILEESYAKSDRPIVPGRNGLEIEQLEKIVKAMKKAKVKAVNLHLVDDRMIAFTPQDRSNFVMIAALQKN